MSKIGIDEREFIKICENSNSMAEASVKLKMHFNTFKRYALKLGCYETNQCGKGISKKPSKVIPLEEILKGLHPQYQTYKLKQRLLKEGIKNNICEVCGLCEWNDRELKMELDHIDGVRTNHLLENLRMICPNCHSQTDTYRAKNRK